jgi:hypothetical protein
MKEAILKVLLENTDTEGRYIGGGEEPVIIVFKHSEDQDRKEFLFRIADEIVASMKPKTGEWSVVKYLRDDRERRYESPKHIHLIEKDGKQLEIQLVDNIYDETLNDKQPTCSDEDPEWDSEWEAYGEFSINYFIGKKVLIESFEPLVITKII